MTPPPRWTPDFRSEAANKLAELFPEVLADGKIDLEALKTLLAEDAAEPSERFGLFWPGKARAIQAAQTPTSATLAPDRENSVDWDSTQNVFIEGDNLEVLKILQKHYYSSVDVIFIDPPYNTGNDFVYADDYKDPIGAYLTATGQVDEEGRVSTNTESSGRFHSSWLSMMQPRLKLAKNLMKPNGVIFITIDDAEVFRLQQLCNEIFGEDNFVACAPRKTGAGAAAKRSPSALRKLNDYVLIYTRSQEAEFRKKIVGEKEYPFSDEHGEFRLASFQASGSDATRAARPNMWYPIHIDEEGNFSLTPSDTAKVILPKQVDGRDGRWLWSPEKFKVDASRFLYFDGKDMHRKIYYDPNEDQSIAQVEKAWFENFRNADGTKEVDALLGRKKIFSHPKPTALIEHLIKLHPNNNALVLDFFAGSGSTAHAVFKANQDDNGKRRFIAIQLPEPTPLDSVSREEGYSDIAQISRERIRRAGKKILEEESGKLNIQEEPLDVGFRAYKLADSSFTRWNLSSDINEENLQEQLQMQADSSKDYATPESKLTELLLKLGLSLTEKIETVSISGLEVFSVAEGLVLAYTQEEVKPSLEQLRALVAAQPAKLVILEDAFQGDDELKTNLTQECRAHGVDLYTA